MRRKYKLILIVLICGLFTYFIYIFNRDNKLNIVALGDGVSSGETAYNIEGISYNDYIKDYFYNKKLLRLYNDNYSKTDYFIKDLIYDIKSNVLDKDSNTYIKQILHNADIITLCFGEEELIRLAESNDLSEKILDKIIHEYDNLLFMLKELTDSKIIIISSYENSYLDKSDIIIFNSELSNLAIKHKAIFININDLLSAGDYFFDAKKLYFNYKAHQRIADMIIHSI